MNNCDPSSSICGCDRTLAFEFSEPSAATEPRQTRTVSTPGPILRCCSNSAENDIHLLEADIRSGKLNITVIVRLITPGWSRMKGEAGGTWLLEMGPNLQWHQCTWILRPRTGCAYTCERKTWKQLKERRGNKDLYKPGAEFRICVIRSSKMGVQALVIVSLPADRCHALQYCSHGLLVWSADVLCFPLVLSVVTSCPCFTPLAPHAPPLRVPSWDSSSPPGLYLSHNRCVDHRAFVCPGFFLA